MRNRQRLTINGYIGFSTRRELSHAITCGKRVRFLEEKYV